MKKQNEQRKTTVKHTHCDRSGADLRTTGHTMSRFNTDEICQVCQEVERRHPEYQHAVEVELAEIRRGNYNYHGAGLPADMQEQQNSYRITKAHASSARKWSDAAQEVAFKSHAARPHAIRALEESLEATCAAINAEYSIRTGDSAAVYAAEQKAHQAAKSAEQFAIQAIAALQNEAKNN